LAKCVRDYVISEADSIVPLTEYTCIPWARDWEDGLDRVTRSYGRCDDTDRLIRECPK